MTSVGKSHHALINGVYYIIKFDSKNALTRTYQTPFVSRQSIATTRSEGEYGKWLVTTQSNWSQGEGQLKMAEGGENRYWYSSGVNITGDSGGLIPLKLAERIAYDGSDSGPLLTMASNCEVVMDSGSFGVAVAYPAHNWTADTPKFLASYGNGSWTFYGYDFTVTNAATGQLTAGASANGTHFVDGQRVTVSNSGGALPTVNDGGTAFAAGVTYYVVNDTQSNIFYLSRTAGGVAITFSGTGTGTHTCTSSAWYHFGTPNDSASGTTGVPHTKDYGIYDICVVGATTFVSFGKAPNQQSDGWISRYTSSGNRMWNDYSYVFTVTNYVTGTFTATVPTGATALATNMAVKLMSSADDFPVASSGAALDETTTYYLVGVSGTQFQLGRYAGAGAILYNDAGTGTFAVRVVNQSHHFSKMASDGTALYALDYHYGTTMNRYLTYFYSFPLTGTGVQAPTVVGPVGGVDGVPQALASHGGTMYGLVTIDNIGTQLYKLSGGLFAKYKDLPDGFYGYGMYSDGSVLYIAGTVKDELGGTRGQIYYITGSGSTETLGLIGTYGNTDGTASQSAQYKIKTRGQKGVYFPWDDRACVGVYDRTMGGLASAYGQSELTTSTWDSCNSMCVYDTGLYFAVIDSSGDSHIFHAPNTSNVWPATTRLDSSYFDFNLPSTEKLFTSLTVVTPTDIGTLYDGSNLFSDPAMTTDSNADGLIDALTEEDSDNMCTPSIDGGQKWLVDSHDTTDEYFAFLESSNLDLAGGDTYSASITYKNTAVNAAPLAIYIYYNGPQTSTYLFTTQTTHADWTTVTITDQVVPTGTTSVKLRIGYDMGSSSYDYYGNAVWAKDFEIIKGSYADATVYYSTNLKTSTWTSLGLLSAATKDTDSDTGFYKYTLELGTGVKAHSLAYRIDMTPVQGQATPLPVILSSTINAITLDRAPGKVTPSAIFSFSVVIATNIRDISDHREIRQGATKLANLRTAFESQTVVEMETIADMGTTYNVLIIGLSELAVSFSRTTKTYEATVQLQAMEI